ncbi:TetR/AcrR family transcriptional regulator [uncultured Robinsoniella sp.]|uniref:TetR/AcrR family transcriptional regulator n=1 Tax=uncultured Robinsoniella sp. TaxID=904190 RepID=UPI00374F5185
MNSKETILKATLELASEKGLGSITLSQIAKKVGIQKTSLYSHFSSKEEIINSLYEYLRETAKNKKEINMNDYGKPGK